MKTAQQKLDETSRKLQKREKALDERLEELNSNMRKLEREKEKWTKGLDKRQEAEYLQVKVNEQMEANKVRLQ